MIKTILYKFSWFYNVLLALSMVLAVEGTNSESDLLLSTASLHSSPQIRYNNDTACLESDSDTHIQENISEKESLKTTCKFTKVNTVEKNSNMLAKTLSDSRIDHRLHYSSYSTFDNEFKFVSTFDSEFDMVLYNQKQSPRRIAVKRQIKKLNTPISTTEHLSMNDQKINTMEDESTLVFSNEAEDKDLACNNLVLFTPHHKFSTNQQLQILIKNYSRYLNRDNLQNLIVDFNYVSKILTTKRISEIFISDGLSGYKIHIIRAVVVCAKRMIEKVLINNADFNLQDYFNIEGINDVVIDCARTLCIRLIGDKMKSDILTLAKIINVDEKLERFLDSNMLSERKCDQNLETAKNIINYILDFFESFKH